MQLTNINIVRQQLGHVCADLGVLKDRDGVRSRGKLRWVVVDVLHSDANVSLTVAASSVHRSNLKPVRFLLLSVQRLQGFQLA